MKYFHLVWAALTRRKTRTILTMLSVLAAFLLFGMLDSVRTAFADAGKTVVGVDRLVTVSKLSFTVQLPLSLQAQIERVPGVSKAAFASWFGGVYQDPKNFFANFAVSDNYLDVITEMQLPSDQLKAFRDTRTGAIVGADLAKRFGWKVGDKIPLNATIWPQKGGSNTWTFDLVGIFHVDDAKLKSEEDQLLFHWKYFDEARQFGNGAVGWYNIKIADPANADRIAHAIDAISANSDHETKTETENAFNAGFVSQFANIGLIVSAIMAAVFFTLILLTGNTMAQAVRERIPELAVLKTLGFSNRVVLLLVLAESVLLVLIGGVVGMLLAQGVVGGVKAKIGAAFPIADIDYRIWLSALGLMIAIGLVVGILPALRGMRLKIVDALAGR